MQKNAHRKETEKDKETKARGTAKETDTREKDPRKEKERDPRRDAGRAEETTTNGSAQEEKKE